MTISRYGKIAVAASFAAVLALPALAIAQEAEEDAGPNFILIRTVNVSTGGNAEWVALQQQLVAAEKEAGEGHRWVWQQVRGSLETYNIVSEHDDRAGFDDQGNGLASLGDAQADWGAAISKTISSRSLRESRIHKNLAIPPDEEAERNLLVIRQITLRQGQNDAFHEWVAERLQPSLIAGGATGVRFSHRTQGGNVQMCTITTEMANWAEFDAEGPFAHMSEGERDGLFAKWDEMVETHEVRVASYRADLSY